MTNALEEGNELDLDFGKLKKAAQTDEDVLPVVAQDVDTGDVLIIGFANEQAVKHTLQEKKATFWSTSRDELWIKGATSGDALEVVEVRVNCEQNSLLYRVRLAGEGACHTKGSDGRSRLSCYYRRIAEDGSLEFF